ncbi:MAG: hypothetical protein ACOVQH_06215 [Burkholderiaceae bacterium]
MNKYAKGFALFMGTLAQEALDCTAQTCHSEEKANELIEKVKTIARAEAAKDSFFGIDSRTLQGIDNGANFLRSFMLDSRRCEQFIADIYAKDQEIQELRARLPEPPPEPLDEDESDYVWGSVVRITPVHPATAESRAEHAQAAVDRAVNRGKVADEKRGVAIVAALEAYDSTYGPLDAPPVTE